MSEILLTENKPLEEDESPVILKKGLSSIAVKGVACEPPKPLYLVGVE